MPPPPPPPPPPPHDRTPLVILAVLFFARVALGYQFQNVGSLAPFLVGDLGLDYAQIGILVGAFILAGCGDLAAERIARPAPWATSAS